APLEPLSSVLHRALPVPASYDLLLSFYLLRLSDQPASLLLLLFSFVLQLCSTVAQLVPVEFASLRPEPEHDQELESQLRADSLFASPAAAVVCCSRSFRIRRGTSETQQAPLQLQPRQWKQESPE